MDGRLKLVPGSCVFFTVPGIPKGKERIRTRVVTPRGKKPFAQIYTPKQTKGFEADVARAARQTMQGKAPFEGPVSVTLLICLPIAKSLPKYRLKAIRDGLEACTKKPDEDNVGKAVKDALNKVIYRDDAQIISSKIIKDFSDTPRVSVTVTEWVVPDTPPQEQVLGLLSQTTPGDKGSDNGDAAGSSCKTVTHAPGHRSLDGKASQSPTACGADSVRTCPNFDTPGAPWCVDCLPPGLRDPATRQQQITVIGEKT